MTIRIEPELRFERAYPWKEEQWIAFAVNNPAKITDAIHALGLQNERVTDDLNEAIGRVVTRYPEDFAPFEDHRPPRPSALSSMRDAIYNWLAGIEVVEENSIVLTQQVPLCIFDAPTTPGSKTTYSEAKTLKDTLGWKVEILGTGFGADLTVAVKHASEFIASAGNRKLVFAPLKVLVVKAGLYKRGDYQGSFLKAELAETEVREANGIRSVSASEWKKFTSMAQVLDRFDTSGDMSIDIAKYTRRYEMSSSFESKLGLKAFDLEASIVAKCVAEHTAEVTFELPAGRVYELWVPSSVSGFFFRP